MLGHNWDHDGGVLGTLALVDGRGVCRHERVGLPEPVGDVPPIERGGALAGLGVNAIDVADVTVVDLLIVVVLDLHHLVARREGPAEPLDHAFASRVQGSLEFDIEGPRAHPAAVHRTQDLDVANRIETEALWDPGTDELKDPGDGRLRVVRRNEVEVAFALRLAQVRNGALVDAMGVDDDLTLGRLAKHLG